jgi:hypothetical protein
LLALGIGAALVAGPAMAQDASATEETSVELDTLNVEDRAADSNPHAEKNAPYKARVSGDQRRTESLAETPGDDQRADPGPDPRVRAPICAQSSPRSPASPSAPARTAMPSATAT